ncbi:DNA-3-methyladenine glycosylase [Engraulis encrasicolus]|uniref:DNA-3-methyladenine glycosylase n=1 Tax=Engraulis encrasicolus TaxID=184585 RepID=UPI002FCFB0BF
MQARKRKTFPVSVTHGHEIDIPKRANNTVQPKGGANEQSIIHPYCQSQYFSCKGNNLKLGQDFFNQPCVSLAKALLGKVLVRVCSDGQELRGRVVETEAYLGGEDKASHSAGGKRTQRNTAMFMKPGTIYVYPIYGIYLCMNISSQGEGAAVLLRALEPLEGHAAMHRLRGARRREGSRPLKDKELCNGPSKLCQALDIPRAFDRRDLADDPEVWLERDTDRGAGREPERDPERDPEDRDSEGAAGDKAPPPLQGDGGEVDVVTSMRIGIESHGEWATKPLRFYVRGNPCVSVRDKRAEARGGQADVPKVVT